MHVPVFRRRDCLRLSVLCRSFRSFRASGDGHRPESDQHPDQQPTQRRATCHRDLAARFANAGQQHEQRSQIGGAQQAFLLGEPAMPRPPAGLPAREGASYFYNASMKGLDVRVAALYLLAGTPEQMAELRDLVLQGPDPAVHKVTRWRCADLREEVARRYDVSVHESTIGKWLHQLGLSRVQPRPYHPQKDPDAEEAFKKTSPSC